MNNTKVIFIPDLHVKNNRYYIKGLNDFFNQELYPLIDKYKTEGYEVIVIQEGDEFDTSSPHWDSWVFLTNHVRQWTKTYIVSGNHTYSIKKGNVSLSLNSISNVEVVNEPTTVKIDDQDFVLMPYPQNNDIKEYYRQYCDKLTESVIVVTHFASTENQFTNEGLNLPLPKNSIVVEGHTHAPDEYVDHLGIKHYTSGVCLPTRKGEEGWNNRLLVYDTRLKCFEGIVIQSSKYFTYESLDYPEQPKYGNSLVTVTNIPKAESKVWRNKYDIEVGRIIGHKFENDLINVYSGEENALEVNYDLVSDIRDYGKEAKADVSVVNRLVDVVNEIRQDVA